MEGDKEKTMYIDFDEYIRKNNGNNNLDNYWVKFPNFGAKCFRDICEK